MNFLNVLEFRNYETCVSLLYNFVEKKYFLIQAPSQYTSCTSDL